MRLLFVSSFYPPFEIGGWEQLTEQIVDGLRARGHDVRVLTSRHRRADSDGDPPHVARRLRLENDQVRYDPLRFVVGRGHDLRRNEAIVRAVIEDAQPQLVVMHTMWNMHRVVPWQAEQLLAGRVAYYLADYWPVDPDVDQRFWDEQASRSSLFAWRRRLGKTALARLERERRRYPLTFQRVAFVSQTVRNLLEARAFPSSGARQVIYNGINPEVFKPALARLTGHRVLFSGSLAPHKGLDTLLRAVALLDDPVGRSVEIIVAGGGHPEHVVRVDRLVREVGLGDRVKRLGLVLREQMPAVYQDAWAFVLPSVWHEPLARALQEAMGCGLPVVASATGGTPELVSDGGNGLLFPANDHAALAAHLRRLLDDPDLARRLGEAARDTVVRRFDIRFTVDNFEDWMARAIADAA